MADNTRFQSSTDPAQPKILDKEVPHSGELAKLQYVGLGFVTGTEGTYTFQELPGDSVFTQSVAAGSSIPTDGVDLFGIKNWGILIPSNFDGTQIQFQMSDTFAGTYVPVRNVANERVVQTVTAGAFHDVFGELQGIRFLKIETVTAQAITDTIFKIIGKS